MAFSSNNEASRFPASVTFSPISLATGLDKNLVG